MHRETIAWLALVMVTIIVTYALDDGPAGAWGLSGAAQNTLILVIAFLKVGVVAYEFMEIRLAPPLLRVATNAWIVGTCGILLFLFPAQLP